MAQIREEIADVMICLVRLADKLNIDIEKAVLEKIALNEKKYPAERSKDKAIKYNKRDWYYLGGRAYCFDCQKEF